MNQFRSGGMNEIVRQAARMQRKIEQVKKDLGDKQVSATSVGDRVRATATYSRKIARLEIDPELVAGEGLELALDAACAAINSALELAEREMDLELQKITGSTKVPGAF